MHMHRHSGETDRQTESQANIKRYIHTENPERNKMGDEHWDKLIKNTGRKRKYLGKSGKK